MVIGWLFETVVQIINVETMIKIAYKGFPNLANLINTFSKMYDVIKMLNGDWLVILPTVIQITNIKTMLKIAYQGFSDLTNLTKTFPKTYDVMKMLNGDWSVILPIQITNIKTLIK